MRRFLLEGEPRFYDWPSAHDPVWIEPAAGLDDPRAGPFAFAVFRVQW
jgi:hypothetical protein